MRSELGRCLLLWTAVVVAALALAAFVRCQTPLAAIGEPVAIIGIFSLPLAYRLYGKEDELRAATLRAASITGGAALAGSLAIAVGGAWSAVSGSLAHLLLVGAIWPTPERVENFDSVEGDGEREEEA